MRTIAANSRRYAAGLLCGGFLLFTGCDSTDVTAPANDAQPSLTVAGGSLTVTEGGDPVAYAVGLTVAPATMVKVVVTATNGRVVVHPDTLQFLPGDWYTPRAVSVQAIDDRSVGGAAVDTLLHTIVAGDAAYTALPAKHVTVDVIDDDLQGETATPGDLSLIEGGPAGNYVLLLSTPPMSDLQLVPLATPDVGLEILPDTLVFSPDDWDVPRQVHVRALADGLEEDVPQLAVIAHEILTDDPGYGAVTAPTIAITVSEVTAPYLTVTGSLVVEAAGHASARVRLSEVVNQSVNVTVRTENGTAIAGPDYTAVDTTLTLPPGVTETSLHIPVADDAIPEPGEYFNVVLASAQHAVIGTSTAVCYLSDDDTPAFSVADTSAVETDGEMTFRVSLSTVATLPARVNVTTVAASAIPGEDYVPHTETVTIPTGQRFVYFTVDLVDDTQPEADELFLVALSAPENAAIGTGFATGTIIDDDGEIITVADITVDEGDGVARFEVVLSGETDEEVEVDVATEPDSATPGQDYESFGTTITIPAGETTVDVAVELVEDGMPEAAESFRLILSDPVGAVLADDTAVCTINDDDQPEVTVDDVTENENTGPVEFRLELSTAAPWPVTVTLETLDGTAIEPADYARTSREVTIPAGSLQRTVTVSIVNDGTAEGDEWFLMQITDAEGALFQTSPARATILDDDLPRVSVGDEVVFEYGGSAQFTVMMSGASSVDVVMEVDTVGESAFEGVDFIGYHATLTIPSGRTAATVIVPVVDDTNDESNESFRLVLSELQNAAFQDATAICTIVDDDD